MQIDNKNDEKVPIITLTMQITTDRITKTKEG